MFMTRPGEACAWDSEKRMRGLEGRDARIWSSSDEEGRHPA
jgi:hypothetical protein